MTERERWIVYPLLFLALGAALRDKIVKSTESQRIKCQGLAVFDANEEPLLVLGAEQFPELRADAPDFLHVDRMQVGIADMEQLDTSVLKSKQLIVGEMLASGQVTTSRVLANKYMITDGQKQLQLDGDYTVQLWRLLSALTNRGRLDAMGGQPAGKRPPTDRRPAEPSAAQESTSPGDATTGETAEEEAPSAEGEPAQD